MKLKTRFRLLKLAFSRKYDHIYWFTFQLKDQRDNGSFNVFVQSHFDGVIQNAPEIIKGQIEEMISNREK